MSDNTRYVARIPIVPDDFENQNAHRNHELVMDFNNDDLYLKKDDHYVNITGDIKEDVKKAIDQATTIHLVTESTVPAIRDRKENHWYYIITKSKLQSSDPIPVTSYIYYGLIKSEYSYKNLLIGQNAIIGTDMIKITIVDNYRACFYIPTYYDASFKNHTTGEEITYELKEKIYAMNAMSGTFEPYNVYILNLTTAGDYFIDITVTENDAFTVQFDTNEPTIKDLVLPTAMEIHQGLAIGTIIDPTWDDPRYIFKGWSTGKYAEQIIDSSIYIPEEDITLYAWFTYESDPTLLEYYSDYESTT